MTTTNRYISDRYDERIDRLAVGLEPIDAATQQTAAPVLRMEVEDVPGPFRPRTPGLDPCLYDAGYPVVSRHASNRFAVLYPTAKAEAVTIRLFDCQRWYVPRRLKVAILPRAEVDRRERLGAAMGVGAVRPLPQPMGRVWTRRPVLFPGAAYQPSSGSTALRGLVIRDGRPMRWARVEGHDPQTGTLLGRAHGDDRGEFLLLIGSIATQGNVARLVDPIRVQIDVFGPQVRPVPDPAVTSDPLWDLPVERTPLPDDPDPVSVGERLPDGYRATVVVHPVVELGVGQVTSRTQPPFVFIT